MEIRRLHILVGGQVQGVGFRPFVYRLADELNLTGWVVNDSAGVTIEVQGAAESVERFPHRLREGLPPLAEIARCEIVEMETAVGEKIFDIRPSESGELTDPQVTVDTAVCEDCLREMRDPADRRYGYPFINCTNCGPRYTIIRRIPYDRPNTTMAEFEMCPACAAEYTDPADRRFHAQPVACPVCGPGVWLARPDGNPIDGEDPIAAAAGLLERGKIVAIKGLGGFHLACRADDSEAVERLRFRKRRDAKPLALMVRDLPAAEALCEISPEAGKLLAGPLRPIVLLPRCPDAGGKIARAVAYDLPTLGLMLPYTPLHHLIFDHIAMPLVMTSANFSDEPLIKDNEAAIAELADLADALLMHNRKIARRLDDSVVQLNGLGQLGVIRRARGYAPQPIRLRIGDCGLWIASVAGHGVLESSEIRNPQSEISNLKSQISDIKSGTRNRKSEISNLKSQTANLTILAVGAELKSAVCLYRDGWAMLGQHIGDLKDGRTYRHFIDTIAHLEALFEVRPEVIACDTHPRYLSSDYAIRRARGEHPGHPPARLIRVQHHHAHAAACLAENDHADEALAIVADGVGYGDDGAVWGCEIFRCDLASYQRLAHPRYIRLPGGDKAAKQTYRPALGALYDAIGEDCLTHPAMRQMDIAPDELAETLDLLRADINSAKSSSLGRWVDAAAALCGIARANRFEGQAPMMLEAAIRPGVEDVYDFAIDDGPTPMQIDLRPMVLALADDVAAGTDPGILAGRFHNTVAAFLHAAAMRASDRTGLKTLAISGGCFMNRYLLARLVRLLQADGVRVLTHKIAPTNDGCIALGQAVSAAARIAAGHVI